MRPALIVMLVACFLINMGHWVSHTQSVWTLSSVCAPCKSLHVLQEEKQSRGYRHQPAALKLCQIKLLPLCWWLTDISLWRNTRQGTWDGVRAPYVCARKRYIKGVQETVEGLETTLGTRNNRKACCSQVCMFNCSGSHCSASVIGYSYLTLHAGDMQGSCREKRRHVFHVVGVSFSSSLRILPPLPPLCDVINMNCVCL